MKDKTMKHPAHSAHKLEVTLNAILALLSEKDKKTATIKAVKECQETLKQLREEMNSRERQRDYEQQMFCDSLTFEFSTNKDFSDSYSRNYESMVINGQTIKNMINNERELQNINDEALFAKITIIDTDPES
jgi:hypothetical protein